jgi:hypothetical protein
MQQRHKDMNIKPRLDLQINVMRGINSGDIVLKTIKVLCNLPPTLQSSSSIRSNSSGSSSGGGGGGGNSTTILKLLKKPLITGWRTKVLFQMCADFLVLSTYSALGSCEIACFSSGVNETSPLLECHTVLIPFNDV